MTKKKKRVLCVCAKGLNRSPYLAKYLRIKGYSTKSGGIEGFNYGEESPRPIKQKNVDWADVIIIVRKRLKPIFTKKYKTKGKKIIVIDVTDSRRLLPAKYSFLKKATNYEFDRKWRRPQLRKAIKKHIPL